MDGKIVLLCKGADSIIKNLLNEKSMDLFDRTDVHLTKFADEGLRTLCLAWKEIPEDEYKEWKNVYHEASTSLEDRDEKVQKAYEQIEQNLTFIGATAIEDKLQDGVPECIARLAKANIKIWVLTGDKQDTAINIGYSCQLITNDMELFIVEGNTETEVLKELEDAEKKIDEILKKVKNNNKKDEEIDEIEMSNISQNINSNNNNNSNNSNFDGCALVINGHSLVFALNSKLDKKLLEVACKCKAVICCRVTPGQKKSVVDLVKKHKKAITLAVGDGANDVSMIKAAHIGVGISGQEGQQAVLASDFSIGQFKYLERLLLVHGRWSYYRISKFLRYFFYKNFASTLCHFWFAFFCGFSAQALFDPFFISTYNVFFSSLPVLALGVFDQVFRLVFSL
jgi:phospholipid-translocating ATPase